MMCNNFEMLNYRRLLHATINSAVLVIRLVALYLNCAILVIFYTQEVVRKKKLELSSELYFSI